MTSTSLQYLLVGLVLAWSLLRVLRQLFPATFRTTRNRLARAATRQGWQHLGAWLQPAEDAADCASGCGGCGGCASNAHAARPVQLRGKMAD